MPKETVLDTIYLEREQNELAERNEYEKAVWSEIKADANEEKLREIINSKIYNKKLSKRINILLDDTLLDLLKMQSATVEKYYKKGFKDGVNLLFECLE